MVLLFVSGCLGLVYTYLATLGFVALRVLGCLGCGFVFRDSVLLLCLLVGLILLVLWLRIFDFVCLVIGFCLMLRFDFKLGLWFRF